MRKNYKEIGDDWQLAEVLHSPEEVVRRCAFKGVNMTAEVEKTMEHRYVDCIFLGCTLPRGFAKQIKDSLIFPKMGEMFDVFRSTLYTADTLYEGYELGRPKSYEQCLDARVYRHYLAAGKQATNIKETLARSLHDHSISTALHEMLGHYDKKRIVGVMGGHGLKRTENQYEQVARISKRLTELGSIMISGGGPGAMEATHLGAWMAGRTEEELTDALNIMREAPCFQDETWLDTALQVMKKYPQEYGFVSIGIPTWLYGHEPSTPLATHIAKYFDNSIREDGILTLAYGGIIFTPGSAGTLQEIFQEAVQDHYLSFGYASPMCFMGRDFWTKDVPVYPFIQGMMERGRYKNLLLTLSDEQEDIVQTLMDFRALEQNNEK